MIHYIKHFPLHFFFFNFCVNNTWHLWHTCKVICCNTNFNLVISPRFHERSCLSTSVRDWNFYVPSLIKGTSLSCLIHIAETEGRWGCQNHSLPCSHWTNPQLHWITPYQLQSRCFKLVINLNNFSNQGEGVSCFGIWTKWPRRTSILCITFPFYSINMLSIT